MKKNVFKLFSFLTLFLLTFFISCEKDFDEVNVEKFNPSYKIKIVYGENFFKEHPEIRSEINSKNQLSSQSRMISSDYNFEIDETKVQIIETDDYDVFTFEIERDSLINNVLENYILIQHANNSIKHFIASYPYNIVNGIKVFTSDASIIEITNPNLVYSVRSVNEHIANPNCFWVKVGSITYMQYVEPENCPCEGHSFGQACTCSSGQPTPGGYQEFEHIFWSYQCNSGGSSNSGSNPSGSGSGGSGGGSKSNEDIITVPFDKDIDFQLENPCDKVKKITNNTNNLKDRINSFISPQTLNLNYEKGFNLVENAENQIELIQNDGNANTSSITITVPDNGSLVAVLHSHYNSPQIQPIFSFEDIVSFNAIFQIRKFNNKSLDKLTLMVVSRAGVFAMIIEDENLFASQCNQIHHSVENYKNSFADFYKNLVIKKNVTDDDVIKNAIDKTNSFGISIYKANSTLSNWDKLSLENNNIISTPCN